MWVWVINDNVPIGLMSILNDEHALSPKRTRLSMYGHPYKRIKNKINVLMTREAFIDFGLA